MELKVFFILTTAAAVQCKLIDLSCSQIRAFVDGHNDRRLLVAEGKLQGQPPASGMTMMLWDEELYAKASRWAKRNLHKHNPDDSIKSNRFETGENLYWYSTTNRNYELQPDKALESWWSEHVNFTFGPLKASDFVKEQDIGHYTQMVWSDSVYLGCAISEIFKNGWKKYSVVCNYGPKGNYLKKTPYKAVGSGSKRSKSLICGAKNCDHPYGPKCHKNDA